MSTVKHQPDLDIEAARITAAGGSVTRVGMCHRLDGVLAVSRGFADFRFKNIDDPPRSQKVSCIPDIYQCCLDTGDFVILGCDGIFDFMSLQTVEQKLRQEVARDQRFDLGLFCMGVLERCLELQRLSKGGQGDNMTLMLIQVGASDGVICNPTNEIYGLEKLERVVAKRNKLKWYAFLEYCGDYGELQPEAAQKELLLARVERHKERCFQLQGYGLGQLRRLQLSERAGVAALFKRVLGDLAADPACHSKVRRVKLTNARMQKAISAAPGVDSILMAVGYVREHEELVLPSSITPEQAAKGAQNMLQRLESEVPTVVQGG